MQLPLERHVFVYGTLRRGEQRDINLLSPVPRWVGWGSLAGVLYDLGSYPGVLLSRPGLVRGEVYEISPELERQLDEIEEVWPQQSGEYVKREVLIRLDRQPTSSPVRAQEKMNCLVYELAGERCDDKPVIASGDWVQHRTSSGV